MNKRISKLAVVFLASAFLFSSAAQSSGTSALQIADSANGKTFKVKSGSIIKVTLNSTFWNFQSSTGINGSETPTMTAIMPGPTAPANCQLPGVGCGTVVWKFKAGKPGRANFIASRTLCGEALRCSAKQSKFTVKFQIN